MPIRRPEIKNSYSLPKYICLDPFEVLAIVGSENRSHGFLGSHPPKRRVASVGDGWWYVSLSSR